MQSLTLLFCQRSLNTVFSCVNLSSFEVDMLLAFIPHPISLFSELVSISLEGSGVLGSQLQLVTAPPRAPTPYPIEYQLCTPFVYLFLITGTPSTCLVWSTTSLLANKIPTFLYSRSPKNAALLGKASPYTPLGSLCVSGKLPTYPSPKPTFFPYVRSRC